MDKKERDFCLKQTKKHIKILNRRLGTKWELGYKEIDKDKTYVCIAEERDGDNILVFEPPLDNPGKDVIKEIFAFLEGVICQYARNLPNATERKKLYKEWYLK